MEVEGVMPGQIAAVFADDVMEKQPEWSKTVSYTHLRAHETVLDLVCRLLLEKKKHNKDTNSNTLTTT